MNSLLLYLNLKLSRVLGSLSHISDNLVKSLLVVIFKLSVFIG